MSEPNELTQSYLTFVKGFGPVTRVVVIEERNDIVTHNNTTVEYSTDALPHWFVGLRFVLEDADFTGMTIDIQDVHYVIRPKEEPE